MDPRAWLDGAPIYDANYQTYTQQDLINLYEASPYEYAHILGPTLFATRIFNGSLSGNLTTPQLQANVQGDPIVNGTSQATVWFSGEGTGAKRGWFPITLQMAVSVVNAECRKFPPCPFSLQPRLRRRHRCRRAQSNRLLRPGLCVQLFLSLFRLLKP